MIRKPVGITAPYRRMDDDDDIQDYKRPWADLSRNEILEIINAFYKNNASEREVKFARLIQEAAKEKNA